MPGKCIDFGASAGFFIYRIASRVKIAAYQWTIRSKMRLQREMKNIYGAAEHIEPGNFSQLPVNRNSRWASCLLGKVSIK